MPRDYTRADFYRPDILNVWVEDGVTRSYLTALWDNPKIKFWIAGGYEGVLALVRAAEQDQLSNVFGVIDRDFRQSNQAAWLDSKRTFRTFVLPVHEIENYILDSSALASSRFSNLNRSPDQIYQYMKERASRLCWWAACREVVADFRRRFRGDFLSDPPLSVEDEPAARSHICDSTWYSKLAIETRQTAKTKIYKLLSELHDKAKSRIVDGSWCREFAGKEILRDVGSRICDRQKAGGAIPTGAIFDADLAKQVAVWQKANNAVPLDLGNLHIALMSRFPQQI